MKTTETVEVLPSIMTIANELRKEHIPFSFIEDGIRVGNTTVQVILNEDMTEEEENKEFFDKLWVIKIVNGEKTFNLFDNNQAIATVRILYNHSKPANQNNLTKYSIFYKNSIPMLGIKTSYMMELNTVEETIEYLNTVFVLDKKDLALMSRLSLDELRAFVKEYRNQFKNRQAENIKKKA